MSSVPIIMAPRRDSGESKAALALAHRAAARLKAKIVISNVSRSSLSQDALGQKLGLSPEELAGCVVESVEGQDVAQALLARARELKPRLIVLTAGGAGSNVSPITTEVISGTEFAALVLRREIELQELAAGHWVRKILVPLDAAPASAEAVRRAARIAKRENASLDLLHITAPCVEGPKEPGSLPVGYFVDRPHYDLKIWSIEFLERFFHGVVPDTSGLTPELHLAVGDVADEIIKFAETNASDLIVMAWQGILEPGRAGIVRELLSRGPCQLLFIVIEGDE
jgi:nucleotide-binding universal stress UspA family protein